MSAPLNERPLLELGSVAEWHEWLATNHAAEAGFGQLNDSARKMALHWIATAKRPETRAGRVAATVEAAAQGRAPG